MSALDIQMFTKLPVTVQAARFDGIDASARAIVEWVESHGHSARWNRDAQLLIDTLEGGMLVSPGDMVVCGVKGEFYPCKPDVFDATYRAADEGGNWYTRLVAERDELNQKLSKLRAFLVSDAARELGTQDAMLLRTQEHTMQAYLAVLDHRIYAAEVATRDRRAAEVPRYRSAETGEYVTQEFAEQNPATTYRESGHG